MPGLIHSLIAELKPRWLHDKQEETLAFPRENQDDPPMPAPTWKPDISEPPIEPESDETEEIIPPVKRREIRDPENNNPRLRPSPHSVAESGDTHPYRQRQEEINTLDKQETRAR
ncbi:hypothetical protein [Limoniibacter endophyticus]|nr:hypothetical protein [Limoniibacter endophyticus]